MRSSGFKITSIGLLILFLSIPNLLFSSEFTYRSEIPSNEISSEIFSSDTELPDKVYTFEANDVLRFEGLDLEDDYLYYIYVEVVTLANLTLEIDLWDPDGDKYDIFKAELRFQDDFAKWYEIPFGTAKGGNYDFEFEGSSDRNFNLYIRIEKAVPCLHDMVSADEFKFLKVDKYTDENYKDYPLNLETDTNYKIYIARVSPIDNEQNSEVRFDFFITDPDDLVFSYCADKVMASINTLNSFEFGTSQAGTHKICVQIDCNVAYVNIAYGVVEDIQISQDQEANNTTPEKEEEAPSMKNLFSNSSSIPPEGIVLTIVGLGGFSLVALVLHILNKKGESMAPSPASKKPKESERRKNDYYKRYLAKNGTDFLSNS